MHVMFIHPNFPAQFGHVAFHLSTKLGWPCTMVTMAETGRFQLPFAQVNYKLPTNLPPPDPSDPSRLRGHTDHALAIYLALRSLPQIQPDLVVGHMTYGTLLYLKQLYKCPFVGYFDLMPPPYWSEAMTLRREYPAPEGTRLFNATFHAMNWLQSPLIDAGYTPTQFQLSKAPPEIARKLRVIFDGVDVEPLKRRDIPRPFTFRGITIPPGARVVTYVSRGLESVRGFDIFMKVAKRISREMDNVIFLIAGEQRSFYGHETHHLKGQSFKQFVLSQDQYDPQRFIFLGMIPVDDLGTLFSLSDLHIYLTVPYVLSWSLVQAMAAGCAIVGSATAPVQEAIDDGVQGLLAGFEDVDGLTEHSLKILCDPAAFAHLGAAAHQRVLERYEMNHCMAQLTRYFEQVADEGVR